MIVGPFSNGRTVETITTEISFSDLFFRSIG